MLADLLLSRGDSRGEFIQLQCAQEAREPHEHALLQTHQARWLEQELGTPLLPGLRYAQFTWRRGFLDEVHLAGETLADAAPLLARQPITSLTVRSGRQLHLRDCELTRDGIEAIVDCSCTRSGSAQRDAL